MEVELLATFATLLSVVDANDADVEEAVVSNKVCDGSIESKNGFANAAPDPNFLFLYF